MKKNVMPIYSLKIAKSLCWHGHPIVSLNANREKQNLLVFFFEDTPEMKRDLGYILERKANPYTEQQ